MKLLWSAFAMSDRDAIFTTERHDHRPADAVRILRVLHGARPWPDAFPDP